MAEHSVRLHQSPGQVRNPEHQELRLAVERALAGEVTTVTNVNGGAVAQIVPIPRADETTRIARVVAELLRNQVILPGAIGMRLDPGSMESWNEQAERWLRNG